jgi:hypothetical protein
MVAAEPIAELLPQELLGVPAARVPCARIGGDPDRRGPGRALLRLGDEPFLTHPRQHHMAAGPRPLEVGPRRQRRRRTRQPGDERAFGQVQALRRPPEEMLRHRLDAVHTGTEIDPVQIELEDLLFRQV